MIEVNPKIITWARKRSGMSIEELAHKMNKNINELRMWEDGTKGLSYSTLEALAYRYFKIPLALFFFPEPPDIEDSVKKFRFLPDYEFERLSSNTRIKIRLAQSYQDSLEEFSDEALSESIIHHDLTPKGLTVQKFATEVREYLGLTLAKQFAFKTNDQAFKAWRYAIEKVGVFTFKDSFQDRYISGFSLIHDYYPVIMINNSNAFTRQTFTLIHELGHILFQVNGITDVDESYIDQMSSTQKALEIKCNQFASEVLVPTTAFKDEVEIFKEVGSEIIPELAYKYSVSREVILRRLLDYGLINQELYLAKSSEWNKDYLRKQKDSTGGNWYLTKISYLGEGFSRIAFNRYSKGKLDKAALAGHLNIKARNLNKFSVYLG